MNFHGGNIYDKNKGIKDYSSNINPLGVPKSFQKHLNANLNCFTQYPEIKYTGLIKNISKYIGAKEEHILLGNGAVNLIYKGAEAFLCKKAVIACPTFSEYKRAMETAGMYVIEKNIYDFKKCCFDMKQLEEMEENAVYVICNPNNPTGSILEKQKLIELSHKLAQKGSFLIVDEAFMDFVLDKHNYSIVNDIERCLNVIVIRAATKFFGMPGIRLGYGITANEELLKKIRQKEEPWNINTGAVLAGEVIFFDKQYQKKTMEWITKEKEHMTNMLLEIKNLQVFPTMANFILLRLNNKNINAYMLGESMEKKGFLIRLPNGFYGLDAQFFRIAIKSANDNISFCHALKKVIEE